LHAEEGGYPNPHWATDKALCMECHEKLPKKHGPLHLRFSSIIALCNRCHATVSKDRYIHASGMVPPQSMVDKMPEEFRSGLDEDGRVTCAVCHEITYQCVQDEFDRKEKNRLFHRGAPYEKRTGLCYNCHEPSAYKKMNPHDQINDEGELITDVCTYCHSILPDRRAAKSIADVKFKFDNFDMLCLRCHTDDAYAVGCVTGYENDGSPIYHSGRPDEGMVDRIKANQGDAILPLDIVEGKIFCGTCHNPHELGVQRREEADVGADSHKRLRISKGNTSICLGCHDEKEIEAFHLP
ncbi:hypothetical protein ACFL0R_06355, partial [Pseudomonadota bacterium]